MEQEITSAQESLSDPAISSDYQKAGEVCALLEELRQKLNERMEEWALLAEQLSE